jgi:N-acetylmuramoyl-L-alanine amidase
MNLISPTALAAITIWAEAQGESYDGKIAVGEVIRNRMKRMYSSDGSVAGTVAQRYQFSFWNDDKQNNQLLVKALQLDDSKVVAMQCIDAWRDSAGTDLTHGAVLYVNLDVAQPAWATDDKFIVKIGHHTFYRD